MSIARVSAWQDSTAGVWFRRANLMRRLERVEPMGDPYRASIKQISEIWKYRSINMAIQNRQIGLWRARNWAVATGDELTTISWHESLINDASRDTYLVIEVNRLLPCWIIFPVKNK